MARTLYLIDAYAQIFRAYYAIRGGMRSPITGEPTHAAFGITGMMIKLMGQLKPDFAVVAIDMPGETFRDEMYEDYKGTREKTPDDLITQIPRIFDIFAGFGLPVIGSPGLEADDVIATIVERVLSDPNLSDVHIRLVSKDKDLEQLLCDRVAMFDIHTDETLDVSGLLEKKGIAPDQVIDLLTMTGDSSDNVPGVAGIGLKTAAQLIQQFGSLDDIYQNLDKLTPKKREAFEEAKAHIEMSRRLVTLERNGPFEFDLEAARAKPPDLSKLLPLFKELGFNRYQDEVKKLGGPAQPQQSLLDLEPPVVTQERGEYQTISTEKELTDLLDRLANCPIVAFDTETTGLEKDAELCGISLSWEEGRGAYIPMLSPEPSKHLDPQAVLDKVKPFLENEAVSKCGHNIKFDARQLLKRGVRTMGAQFDTMLAGILIDPAQSSQKLDHLADMLLGYTMIPITDLIGAGKEQGSMADVPLDKIAVYAAEDADIALRLRARLQPQIEAMGMARLLEEVESPLCVAIAEMEHTGILCDPDELLKQGKVLEARAADLKQQVFDAVGEEFSIESTRQLAEVLFDKLGFKSVKNTKTGRSTDIEVLETLAAQEDKGDPKSAVPRLLIEYRQLQKLISTYLGNLRDAIDPKDGRIHSTFHQLVAATGRLASQNPNLQNIPVRTDVGRQIRKAFVAPPGWSLICADYSQIELRVLAHFSQDEALLEAFKRDEDIHAAVASQVFNVPLDSVSRQQRDRAKTINFGIIYGVTPYGLSRRIEGLEVSDAAKLIDDYKAKFSGIATFMEECIQQALQHGYVSTILGRRRAIPEIVSPNRNTRALGERLAINTVVQGSAADLIKVAMVNLWRRVVHEGLPMRLLLQIHDELIFEAPDEKASAMAEIVRAEMESALELRAPLKAEAGLGKDWLSAK